MKNSSEPEHHKRLQSLIDAEQVMDILASLVDIRIPATSRTMVAAHLHTASVMADIVYSAPLDKDAFEPAAVFTPEERK